MTIPWLEQPRTLLDTVTDLAIQASVAIEMLQTQKSIQHNNPAFSSTQREQYCSQLTKQLESWHDGFVPLLTSRDAYHEHNDGNSQISINNLAKTHLLLMFWSISLLLSAAVSKALPSLEMPLGFEIHNLRYNILKRLRPCFRQEAGWFGANIALFPIGTIFRTLDASPLSPSEERLVVKFLKEPKMRGAAPMLRSVGQNWTNLE